MAAIDLRYARALAQVVAEKKIDAAAVERELADFADVFAENAELREVLEDPSIPEAQKLKVLDGIAGKLSMSATTRNFIAVLAAHDRLPELSAMLSAFTVLADATTHIADAEVTSAKVLDQDNRTLLEQQIAKLTGGGQVRATYLEDPALLGGAIVRVGSTVYDGSIRTQLQRMKEQLMAVGV